MQHRGHYRISTKKKIDSFQEACNLSEELCDSLFYFEKDEAARRKAEQRGKKWVGYGGTDNESFFYDKTSIKQMANKHVRVWFRSEVDDVNAYIEGRKKKDMPIKGYENYSHTLQLWELDCANTQVRTVSEVRYDDKGSVLYSYQPDKSEAMESIVPDSNADALYQIVCKGKKPKDL